MALLVVRLDWVRGRVWIWIMQTMAGGVMFPHHLQLISLLRRRSDLKEHRRWPQREATDKDDDRR
jgi:hypothetical protein